MERRTGLLEFEYALCGSEDFGWMLEPFPKRIIGVDRVTALTLEARVGIEACA